MLSKDLFHKVLLEPAVHAGGKRLLVVSGYASAAMADHHMEKLSSLKFPVSIELIIGMPCRDGIQEAQHLALRRLAAETPWGMAFHCRYVTEGAPVHAKTYCWMKGKKPLMAFAGSANYTLTAFGRSQIETMTAADARAAAKFHAKMLRHSEDCADAGIQDKIQLLEARRGAAPRAESVTLSLLARTGETPSKSGVNWGQRPGRDRDQAYVNIPTKIGRSGFFPARYEQFTVLTDDGHSFIMVRAQDEGKGLHTTHNNALLGEYLRKRMKLEPGQYVTRAHLEEYGRADVTFTKIDDETYLMDFHPGNAPGESKDAEARQE